MTRYFCIFFVFLLFFVTSCTQSKVRMEDNQKAINSTKKVNELSEVKGNLTTSSRTTMLNEKNNPEKSSYSTTKTVDLNLSNNGRQYQSVTTSIKSKDYSGKTYTCDCEGFTGLQNGHLISVFKCHGQLLQGYYNEEEKCLPLATVGDILNRWNFNDNDVKDFIGQGTVAFKNYLRRTEKSIIVLYSTVIENKDIANVPSVILVVDKGDGSKVAEGNIIER